MFVAEKEQMIVKSPCINPQTFRFITVLLVLKFVTFNKAHKFEER